MESLTTTGTIQSDIEKYKWYTNKKLIGVFLLIITITLQVFAFVEFVGITTFHAYTIGLLLGYFSPIFYLVLFYIALSLLFGNKIYRIGIIFLNLNWKKYLVIAFSSLLLFVSLKDYASGIGYTNFGFENKKAFTMWFDKFTNFEQANWWLPSTASGGVLGATFYFLFSSFLTGIGTIVISSFLLILGFLSIFFEKPFRKFYRRKNNANDITKTKNQNLEEVKTKKNKNSSVFTKSKEKNNSKNIQKNKNEENFVGENLIQSETTFEIEKKNDLPFDDPFGL